MQIQYTEDGYLRLCLQRGEVNFSQISRMNMNVYMLPSFRDRYEANVVLYHIGEYSSLSGYFSANVLSFNQFKSIVLKCIDAFLSADEMGLNMGNILYNLDYIFINQRTKEIKVIYCPLDATMDVAACQKMLRELAHAVQTDNAALLVGTLLENVNRNGFNVNVCRQKIDNLSERAAVPEVKIVERTISAEGGVKGGLLALTSIGVMAVLMTAVPFLAGQGTEKGLFSVPKMGNYIMCGISVLAVLVVYRVTGRRKKAQNIEKESQAAERSQGRTSKEQVALGQNFQRVQQPLEQAVQKNAGVPMERRQGSKNIQMEQERFTESEEMMQARVSRNNPEPVIKSTQEYPAGGSDPGTVVLSPNGRMQNAYMIEDGKNSIMDRIYIDTSDFTIGRESDVDYRINESVISKKHAVIKFLNGEYYLIDLGSKNCTYLNSNKIEANKEYKLDNGSRISIGNKSFIFNGKQV